MDPLDFLKSLGGVARVGTLRRKGVWALPDADPEFRRAIMDDSLLTCASSASRYGLWLKDRPGGLHLAGRHRRSTH